jgi:hypothetical protein
MPKATTVVMANRLKVTMQKKIQRPIELSNVPPKSFSTTFVTAAVITPVAGETEAEAIAVAAGTEAEVEAAIEVVAEGRAN